MSIAIAALHFWPKVGSGAAGAAVWIILIHGLPVAWRAANGELTWNPTFVRSLGVTGVLLGILALGAGAAIIADANSSKDAFAWGLAWQSVFGESAKQYLQSEQRARKRGGG